MESRKNLILVLRALIYERNVRNPVLLIIVNLVLAYVAYGYWKGVLPLPHQKMLKCSSKACGHSEVFKFYSLDEVKCPKCKSPMRYAMKCRDCSYEYGYEPFRILDEGAKTPEEIYRIRREEAKCPNCGSLETDYVQIQ